MMGVGLQPLEFTECLADSPQFRDNLQRHEKELEQTSQQIKRLIKEVKDVVQAAKRLGAAQLALASSMEQFEFACIGASMTEDERIIGRSLQHFANLIRTIEDERERMLGRAHEQIIQPLEKFRKEHIGAVKEGKKKFDKKTAKFCQSQERTLSLSTKKQDNVFQEADAAMEMAERDFCGASLEYVFQLQAVQERKKFELVETLLGFVFGWWTFHHTAHDVHADAEPLVRDLQLRIQRTRTNFEETSKQTESLMKKMMEMRQVYQEDEANDDGQGVTRAGYIFLMEKKAFGTAWTKQYCTYEKSSRILTLLPYNQINVKSTSPPESVCVCGARRCVDGSVERRFCWEAVPSERDRPPLTLQSVTERDRAAWLRAIDSPPATPRALLSDVAHVPVSGGGSEECCALDEAGFTFVRRLIAALEARGLEEQGLYRIAGVTSKVSRLVSLSSDVRRVPSPTALADVFEWETKTLTSALKSFLRALPEPLLTHALHQPLIAAAKRESWSERVSAVQALIHALPPQNYEMLHIVIRHLRNVAAKSDKNLMTISNLAVCFGPTLLRAERETVASILELKFYNVLVETLLEHSEQVFTPPAPNGHIGQPPIKPPGQHTGLQAGNGSLGQPPINPLEKPARLSTVDSSSQPQSQPGGYHAMGGMPPNGHIRASPTPISTSRSDIISAISRASCEPPRSGVMLPTGARYSAHQQQLLQQFAGPLYASHAAHRPPPSALLALRGAGRSSSSSAESISSCSASPPPANPAHPAHARNHRYSRVRTLYACLGESDGELSFEPNQIITNVVPSPEPGWLRGTLNGKTGLVPENYVEPLP